MLNFGGVANNTRTFGQKCTSCSSVSIGGWERLSFPLHDHGAFRETPPFCSDLQVTSVVMPFVELLEPPPFAVGWCRIRMHDLTIEIPEAARWEFVIFFLYPPKV